tara:strand:- start:85 stop:246 length:162 start_codon:yes stop_codon:yes gene_type:complete
MKILKNIETGIINTLEDPFGACIGAAWWILCLGVGAAILRGVINFVFQLNGLT